MSARGRRGLLLVAVAACAALGLAAPLASAGTGGAAASAAAPRCQTANLVIWLPNGMGSGAAGSVFYKVRLTNLGGKACTVSGFPAVSAVDLNGSPVGKAASQEGKKGGAVKLAPGASANFQLRIVEAGNFSPSACHPTMAAGLRVQLAGGGGAKIVPLPFEACAKATVSVLAVGTLKG